MDERGEIHLDGVPYTVDVLSYRVKDIVDFAPRAATPGGSVVMSDLQLYQPLMQTDWQHGFGFHWHEDSMGYMRTEGSIDTRHSGIAMLFTAPSSALDATASSVKSGICVFNNIPYSWGTQGIRKYSGGSWTSIYSGGAVNWAINAGTYMFFCPNGGRIRKMDTSETVSNAGADADAQDYRWMVIHNGYIYAGRDATNRVHYSDKSDLNDLEGTTSDPSAIYVGSKEIAILEPIVYAGNLYVAKADGLWHIGEDKIARKVVDMSGQFNRMFNYRGMAVVNGLLIFPIRDKIYQWNAARIADITPGKITDSFPYTTYGAFDNLVEINGMLFCTARTNETSYSEHLLCWDGASWHKLSDLIVGSTTLYVSMLAYDCQNQYIWYHIAGTGTGNGNTYYIPLQPRSMFPYASFPTTGTHSLYLSRMDMGYRRVTKSVRSILVETSNITTARYLAIYYALDGGSWTHWGDVKSNGVRELFIPGTALTEEFNYIQIRVDFITTLAAQSPILEGLTLRFIMRPDVSWGYNFNIIAADYMERGRMRDTRTAQEIIQALRALRDSKAPVSMQDITGNTVYGYISAISEMPRDVRSTGESIQTVSEFYVNVNFVETG